MALSLTFSNVTVYNPTFSFQEVKANFRRLNNSYMSTGPVPDWPWYWYGCIVDDTRNCTAACQDASMIFKSPYTFGNCMVLAALQNTSLNEDGSLLLPYIDHSVKRYSSAPNANVTLTNAFDFGQAFAVPFAPSALTEISKTVQQVMQGCFSEYCNMTSKYPGSPRSFRYCAGVFRPYGSSVFFPDICGGYSAPLNQDIGGIGVSLPLTPCR